MFYSERAAHEQIVNFIYLVYGWMSFALGITAVMAYYVASTPAIFNYIFSNPGLPAVLMVTQIILVITLSAMINRLNYSTAVALFIVYAATLGISLSTVFMVYTLGSIYTTFAVTAGTFGSMALYGYVTKSDLSGIGAFASMALWGLIIGLVVNLFLQNSTMDYVLSAIGILLFTALTAYDMNRIKQLAQTNMYDEQTRGKTALIGALILYLDFINLFMYMLRFLGNRKE